MQSRKETRLDAALPICWGLIPPEVRMFTCRCLSDSAACYSPTISAIDRAQPACFRWKHARVACASAHDWLQYKEGDEGFVLEAQPIRAMMSISDLQLECLGRFL